MVLILNFTFLNSNMWDGLVRNEIIISCGVIFVNYIDNGFLNKDVIPCVGSIYYLHFEQ